MKKQKIIIPLLMVIVIFGIFIYKRGFFSGGRMNSDSVNDENVSDRASSEFDLDATSDFDLEKLKGYKLPIIIDFGYESCPGCKVIAPILKKVNEKYQGRVLVKYVDIQKNPEAAKDFPLRVVPTQFFFYADGTPYMPGDSTIDFMIYSDRDTEEPVYTVHEGVLEENEFDEIIKELEAK